MGMQCERIGDGDGWRLDDILCDAGPGDRPFEEQHALPCIALVRDGSFVYRTATGRALLAPGACLLGTAGQSFECSHEHHRGDRCLSFHYEPWLLEQVAAAVPGTHRLAFQAPRLAPATATLRLAARVETARLRDDRRELEECALELAALACEGSGVSADVATTGARDLRRVSASLRRLGQDDEADLAALAEEACMSRYHFLRVFRRVVGMTPRQYQLRGQLERAAIALGRGGRRVSDVAYECGFGDLSSFERQFRRSFGVSPRGWLDRLGRR